MCVLDLSIGLWYGIVSSILSWSWCYNCGGFGISSHKFLPLPMYSNTIWQVNERARYCQVGHLEMLW